MSMRRSSRSKRSGASCRRWRGSAQSPPADVRDRDPMTESPRFAALRAARLKRCGLLFLLLALACFSFESEAQDTRPPEQWPTLDPGIWEIETSRMLPNGRKRDSKEVVSECSDATELLRGYWGFGRLAEAGCRYSASKHSERDFEIKSECMVQRSGVTTSSAAVVVKDKGSFEFKIEVLEGKRVLHGTLAGRRRSACPPERSAP